MVLRGAVWLLCVVLVCCTSLDVAFGSVIGFDFTLTTTGLGFGVGFESQSCPDITKEICCRSVIFETSTEPSAFRGNTFGRCDIV